MKSVSLLAVGLAMTAAALASGTLVRAATAPSISAPGAVIDNWTGDVAGAHGVPAGWTKYETPGGHPAYDLAVVDDDGRRALRLRSHDEHTTIAKELHVDLAATPVLLWSWKVVTLPAGADLRQARTSDLTAHIYIIWPRFPALLRSRIIGYVWDATAPSNAIEQSRKTRTTSFVIVHSGVADLGRWITERRNVYEDYRRIYGDAPDNPRAIALSIDTNDTHATAEALLGPIAFEAAPGPPVSAVTRP